jgi:metallo-beta-lactamase family protein
LAHVNGLSGHADRSGLLNWLSHFQSAPRKIFLKHRELAASEALAEQITTRYQWDVEIPEYGDAFALA